MARILVPVAPWQGKLLADPSRYKAAIGGVGSGKSFGFSEDFIKALTLWPRSQSAFVLGTHKQYKEGAQVTLKYRLTHHFGAEGKGWTQNKTDLSITIRRGPAAGHRIVAWSAETYETLKSSEYDFIWCDEVQTWQYPREAVAFLFTRQRNSPPAIEAYSQRDENGVIIPDTCALPLRMWISANPPWNTAHYLYQRFVANRSDDDEFSFYHVKTLDNTLLQKPEEYVARLRRELPPDVFKIEVLGEWGDIGVGRVYTSFYRNRATSPHPDLPSLHRNPDGTLWKSKSGVHRIAIDHSKPIIWPQDFGVQPRAATILQMHELPRHIPGYQRKLVYVLDAIEIPNGSTDLMIQEFARRYPPKVTINGVERRRKVFVYGDPAGRTRNSTTAESDWDYMKRSKILADYDIEYVYDIDSPYVADRVLATNAKLCNADDEIGMLFDPGDADRPAAKLVCDDMQQVVWKAGTRLLDHGTPAKGIFRTHLSDTIGYFAIKQFPIALKHVARMIGIGATSR